ncbi:MAG: DUF799 family lipoprotein [Desulfobacterales bacterium]
MFKFADRKQLATGLTAWVVAAVCLSMLSGCGSRLGLVKDGDDEGQRIIVRNPPKSIAILPFGNQTESADIDEFVRTTFYSHLSAQPYKDIELYEVDRKLRYHDLDPYNSLSLKSARRLGRILGCDAVVVGTVTEYQRLYAGLYSQIAVGASIAVWDTRTGKRIWSDEHVTRQHEGGIPLALTDFAMIGIRSGMNLTESEKIKTVDELSRYLTGRIPIPDISGGKQGSKFVSLKRLTKTENQDADEPESKSSRKHTRKLSLKKLTKVNHPRYR